MNLSLQRFSSQKDSTLGIFKVNGEYECFSLEDEYREVKVAGETRIPAGHYEVEFYEIVTPMTERYRKKYPWFTYHIHIKGVKNFKNVYIHIGNDDDDTEGCILLGDGVTSNRFNEDNNLSSSRVAFERFYRMIHPILKSDEKVMIRISDN